MTAGIEVSDLFSRKKPVTVEVNGVAFEVVYDLRRFDARISAELNAQMDVYEEAGRRRRIPDQGPLCQLLSELLVSWNLFEDGEPVPITAESIASYPEEFAMEIMTAINADRATAKNEARSSPTLRAMEPSAKRRSGTR